MSSLILDFDRLAEGFPGVRLNNAVSDEFCERWISAIECKKTFVIMSPVITKLITNCIV
jgi:hypothetical protein